MYVSTGRLTVVCLVRFQINFALSIKLPPINQNQQTS